jgi:hypothetical protein
MMLFVLPAPEVRNTISFAIDYVMNECARYAGTR